MEKPITRLLPNGAADLRQVFKDDICNEVCSKEYNSKVFSQKELDEQFKSTCCQSNDVNELTEVNLNSNENLEVHQAATFLESASLTSRFTQQSNMDKLNLTRDFSMKNLQSELLQKVPKVQISETNNTKRNLLIPNLSNSRNYSPVNFTSKKSYLNYIGAVSSFLRRVWPSSKSNDTTQSSSENVNETVVSDETEFVDSADSSDRSSNNSKSSSERVTTNSSIIKNMHVERTLDHCLPDSFPSTSKKEDNEYKQVASTEINNAKDLTYANIFQQHSNSTVFRDMNSATDSYFVERPTKDYKDNLLESHYSETFHKLHEFDVAREAFQSNHFKNGLFWHNTGLPDCKWFQEKKNQSIVKDMHFQCEETNKFNQMEHFSNESVPEFGPKKFQKEYNGLKRSTNLKELIEQLHQSFRNDFVCNNTEKTHTLSKDNITSFKPIKSPQVFMEVFQESKQSIEEFTEKNLENSKSNEIQSMFDICSDSENTADNLSSNSILKAPQKGKKRKRRKKFNTHRKRQSIKSTRKIQETKSSVASASKYLNTSTPTILNRPRRGLRNAKEISALTKETTEFQEYCNSIQSQKNGIGLTTTNSTSNEQHRVIKLCSPALTKEKINVTEITLPENFLKGSNSLIVQKKQTFHRTSFHTNHRLSLQLKADNVKRVFEVISPKCKSEKFLHSKITAKLLSSNSYINQSTLNAKSIENFCSPKILARRPTLERKAKLKALALLSNKIHVAAHET